MRQRYTMNGCTRMHALRCEPHYALNSLGQSRFFLWSLMVGLPGYRQSVFQVHDSSMAHLKTGRPCH